MPLTDIRQVKAILEIDQADTSEDLKLSMFIDWVSEWIPLWCNRGDDGFAYAQRTQYYDGTGTQKVLLNNRPIDLTVPTQVYEDMNGFYGNGVPQAFNPQLTQLTYGSDYVFETKDNVTSRSGILVRINDYWQKPSVRSIGFLTPYIGYAFGSIKIVYTAGYTTNTLPFQIRQAAVQLVSKLRYYFPLGLAVNSDSYEEKSISLAGDGKNYLLNSIVPAMFNFRNWKW